MTRSLVPLLGLLLGGLPIPPLLVAAEMQDPPPQEQLTKAGAATLQKFASTAATWRTRCQLPNGAAIEAQVVRDKNHQSWTFFFVSNGRSEMMSRLIETDGIWYVIEGKRQAKYRPYEADLSLPGGYLFLVLSEARCVQANDLADARFVGREGGVAAFRRPLAPEGRQLLEKTIGEMERLAKQDPKLMEKSGGAQALATARKQLAEGIPLKVDGTTGLLCEMKFNDLVVTLENFHWLDATSEADFALPAGGSWDDQTKPWSAAEMDDCVMVWHDRLFQAGNKNMGCDTFLLNLQTGRLRRVPYNGISSTVGCFLPGRREVLVSGFDIHGPVGLIKVNLDTGRNIPLEPEASALPLSLMAEVSPDGKSVATAQMLGGGQLKDLQPRIVTLADGHSRVLGKPSPLGTPFSWLPDGSGLLFKRFEAVADPQAVEPRIICRVGLDGKHTDVRPGEWPVVLRKSHRILYLNMDSRLWYTCQLDGSKPELYADGMSDHATPAVSSDETKIVFVRHEKGQLPDLRLYEFGKTEGRSVSKEPGFTGTPVWR
jgi:hypothetical protein